MSFLSRWLFRRTTKVTHDLNGKYLFEEPSNITEKVVVSTTGGNVIGFKANHNDGGTDKDSSDGNNMNDVKTFRGVPFATHKRNKPSDPIMEEQWSNDRECLMFGPACPQPTYGLGRIAFEGLLPAILESFFPPLPTNQSYSYGNLSENDCLNLNIYTTTSVGSNDNNDNDEKKPVLVWIHGGSCQSGSNVEGGWYDATKLAAEIDACVVTINYRIHMFGFCHFPKEQITNLGIRDQIAALQWIQANIENFGGNRNNVTIIGESSGGTCVGTLIGCPLAKGLFHKAIPMSLATLKLPYRTKQWEQMLLVLEKTFAKELQGQPLTSTTLAELTQEQIQYRMSNLGTEMLTTKHLGTNKLPFGPYCDGDVVPYNGPHEYAANSGNNNIPILCGTMRDEWKLFTHLIPVMPTAKSKNDAINLSVAWLRCYFETTVLDEEETITDSDAVVVVAAAAAKKWEAIASDLYDHLETIRGDRGQSTDPTSVYEHIVTLLFYKEPMYCFARDTGSYQYTIELDDEPYQSSHGRDVIMLFKGGYPNLFPAQDAKLFGDWNDPTHPIHEVSHAFLEAVSSFIRTGRPTVPVSKDEDNNNNNKDNDKQAWDVFPNEMVIKTGGCEIRSTAMLPEIEYMQQLKKRVVDEFDEVNGELII